VLPRYGDLVGRDAVEELRGYRRRFAGRRIVHVSSTFTGGGVAEILSREVPLANEAGIAAEWYRILGDEAFFTTTKGFHNALQGRRHDDPEALVRAYVDFYGNGGGELNRGLIEYLAALTERDVVIVHDPQPLYLIRFLAGVGAVKLWRTHIDTSAPDPCTMEYVAAEAERYDGVIATRREYVEPHLRGGRIYSLAPSIDPFSDKNAGMDDAEVAARLERHGVRRDLPLLVQVSRLDPWKDPVGVIDAFERLRQLGRACRLALVYSPADDDPEGAVMEALVRERRGRSPWKDEIHLVDGSDPRDVNAFQRGAALVLQNSIREGFGLTVTEALYKGRPVVANAVGGITLQVQDGVTGFAVAPFRVDDRARPVSVAEYERHTEAFAATCTRALDVPEECAAVGARARASVVANFFATAQLRNLLEIVLDCGPAS